MTNDDKRNLFIIIIAILYAIAGFVLFVPVLFLITGFITPPRHDDQLLGMLIIWAYFSSLFGIVGRKGKKGKAILITTLILIVVYIVIVLTLK